MRVSFPLIAGGLLALGVAGGVWLTRGGASSAEEAAPEVDPSKGHPNVLFVMWDTVRADRLSLYGYAKPTTPHLEAFARDALVFERAVAPGMWTLPSHGAFFTGLPPASHGAHASYRWLDEHHVTLAEHFGAHGYATYAFSSNLIASPLTNLFQGFEEQHLTYKPPHTRRARQLTQAKLIDRDASTEISPAFRSDDPNSGWDKAVFKDATPLIHQQFVQWLDARGSNQPFFAYLNLMEAHTPRIPSMNARRKVMDEDLIEVGLKTDQSLFNEVAWMVGKREYSERELEAIGGSYDAALIDLDEATGALFDSLRERGILDDTLVVLVADHGESLGSHRLLEHRYSVYDELLHVPLVLRWPGHIAPGRVAEPVSTIDLFTTLIELAELPAVGTQGTRSHNLLNAPRPSHVVSQMLDPFESSLREVRQAWPDLDLSRWLRTYSVIVDGSWKYIRASDGEHELYDVQVDPGETQNLLLAQPSVAQGLHAQLDTWEASLTPYDPDRRTEADRAAQMPHDAATRRQLELLGYVEEEADAPVGKAKGRGGKAGRGRGGRRP